MTVLAFVVTAVLVPMLVNEFTDWLPWFAARMIRAAARTLPPTVRMRYAAEWLAELDAVPGGNLSKIVFAARVCIGARATAAAYGAPSLKFAVTKGLFDKVAAASALVVLAPLFTAAMIAIWATDRGPVFVRQTMIGKDGHTFSVWRFRTMVVAAEKRKAELTAHNEADGALFKMHQDTRVTRPGAWLRRYSLNELPQLYSVLFGDMSFVGPRPASLAEAVTYRAAVRDNLAVKPGLTGLWQINGRSDLAEDLVTRLDRRYLDNWSLVLDLQILWKSWCSFVRVPGDY